MTTFFIYFNGLVQGIGFRPCVHAWAEKNGLLGSICNAPDGVKIYINCPESQISILYEDLCLNLPKLAIIKSQYYEKIDFINFKSFEIVESREKGEKTSKITPDFAICADCKTEIFDFENKRYLYAFATCSLCGPRFSIVKSLPYDRENTEMHSFKQCSDCKTEYGNIKDRRYFSQTNSCIKCGIQLEFIDDDTSVYNEIALNNCIKALQNGKIIAVKGIGGFLFLADATKPEILAKLRHRKQRPTKAFAVLFSDVNHLKKYAQVSEKEKEILESKEAPIVLLKLNQKQDLAINEIAPKIKKIGALLAYTPLLQIITKLFGKALVATSANISGGNIIFSDHQKSDLLEIADCILSNNRAILLPQDDSVIRVSPVFEKNIIIRRSRGFAPNFWGETMLTNKNIIAFGADMKSSLCIQTPHNLYISQYLGDMSSFETQNNFENLLAYFTKLLDIKEYTVICDSHEAYYSTALANKYAKPNQIYKVQHHLAHFFAVLQENKLLKENAKVLGIIWDGLGLGTDGNMWGGSSFALENSSINVMEQNAFFPIILSDKMAKEPRISALSMCYLQGVDLAFLKDKFNASEWSLYPKLLAKSKLFTNSIGRVFDSVAALINVCNFQTYEGEAAIILEELATEFFEKCNYKYEKYYCFDNLCSEIIQDIKNKIKNSEISAKFHLSLVKLIEKQNNNQYKQIAFSGGVFQNALLVDLLQIHLIDFELFFHKDLSPNDENISFGQLIAYQNQQNKTIKICV